MLRKVSISRFFVLEALYSCFSGLVHPITPTMFNNLGFPDYVFGLVFASMSLGMFLFSPFWGKLGDRIGHSKAFAAALPLYAVSQVVFGMAGTPSVAVAARFFSGFSGGGAMVAALAYIINATTSENRGKMMAYYAALNSVSKALGFFIGGMVGTLSIPAVFILQAVLLLLGSVLTLVWVKDPKTVETKYRYNKSLNPFEAFMEIKGVMTRPLFLFLSAVLLTSLASTTYDNSFNYYINTELKLPPSYNGIIKAITGLTGLTANFTINVYLANRTDMRKSLIVILLLCGVFALIVPFMPTPDLFFTGIVAFYLFNTLYIPIQQVLIMSDFDTGSSGSMSGIFNSVRSIGLIFGSLIQGFLYALGSLLPFILSSAIFILGAFTSLSYYRQAIKEKKAES